MQAYGHGCPTWHPYPTGRPAPRRRSSQRSAAFGATNAGRDVSPVGNNFDPAAPVNRNSALAWHYGGEEARPWRERDCRFGRTLSTVAVVDGLVYAAELGGHAHCLDAATGRPYWQHDTMAAVWGSPYYVDGKVLVGTEDGDVWVYRHDPRRRRSTNWTSRRRPRRRPR